MSPGGAREFRKNRGCADRTDGFRYNRPEWQAEPRTHRIASARSYAAEPGRARGWSELGVGTPRPTCHTVRRLEHAAGDPLAPDQGGSRSGWGAAGRGGCRRRPASRHGASSCFVADEGYPAGRASRRAGRGTVLRETARRMVAPIGLGMFRVAAGALGRHVPEPATASARSSVRMPDTCSARRAHGARPAKRISETRALHSRAPEYTSEVAARSAPGTELGQRGDRRGRAARASVWAGSCGSARRAAAGAGVTGEQRRLRRRGNATITGPPRPRAGRDARASGAPVRRSSA